MAERYVARHERHRVAALEEPLVSFAGALSRRANTIAGLALELTDRPKASWTLINIRLAALLSEVIFDYI